VNGSVYIVSATIASAGNTALEWTLDGVETSETVTASEVRYSIEYTGDGAAADIGLRDPNAAGFGAITFTDFQIERAPTGSTPLPYISSAEPTLQCVGCVKATDDFDTADAVAAGFSGEDVPITVMAVVRTDSVFVASNDIFTLGRSSTDNPRWRVGVDSNNKWFLSIRDDTGSGPLSITSTDEATPGLWHVLACVTDGTAGQCYLDGSALAGASGSLDVGTLTVDQATIGALRRTTTSNYFNGTIADVVVANSPWTSFEALQRSCEMAVKAWNENWIPIHALDTLCTKLDLTVLPTGP
jgi:hypothetical protein